MEAAPSLALSVALARLQLLVKSIGVLCITTAIPRDLMKRYDSQSLLHPLVVG